MGYWEMNFEQIWTLKNEGADGSVAAPHCVIILETVQEKNLLEKENKLTYLKAISLGFEFETVDWCLLDKLLLSPYQYSKYKLKKRFNL